MNNAINDLLDAIIPKLADLLTDLRFFMGLAMAIGPALLLIFGGFYLFFSPKEANHKAGYRTHFGMGSVGAWRFTQSFAGRVFLIAGGALAIAAVVGCILLGSREMAEAVKPAFIILLVEVFGVIAAVATVELTVLLRFDQNGNRRKK